MIPDCQVTPDTPTDHLRWIGEYIVEQKPDVVVNIGDFADMESLSSYDRVKRSWWLAGWHDLDIEKGVNKFFDDVNRPVIEDRAP